VKTDRPASNAEYAILFALFVLACALRVFQLGFFEFKNDQLAAIALGYQTRAAGFLIAHGMPSGVGLNNPPLFLWFMASATWLTGDPLRLTALFTALNLVAVALAYRHFAMALRGPPALLAAAVLAVAPAFVFYSNIVWAQCLLPPVVLLFQMAFCRFVAERRGATFVWMTLLAMIAAQLHLSGCFLFPVVAAAALSCWRALRPGAIALAAAVAALLSLPYLYHLFCEGELRRFLSDPHRAVGSAPWSALAEPFRMSSAAFLKYYFREDFVPVLRHAAGPAWRVLYALSCGLAILYGIALLRYLLWAVRKRRFVDAASVEIPLPVQVAGCATLGVVAGYCAFRVQTPPHYFLVLFPASAVLVAWTAGELWTWSPRIVPAVLGRAIALLPIGATAILTLSVLLFLRDAGGHPAEYGPGYGRLLKWKADIWMQVPAGYEPSLAISRPSSGKFDTAAITSVLLPPRDQPAKGAVPLTLTVHWDPSRMRYVESVASGASP
jgi:4-amino-4-deoxy-L-arabinose transferase-like glycosyltransferase